MASIAPEYESYTKRILELLGEQNPLEVQRKTVGRLRRALRDLSRKQLKWNPAPGKWSITQIISHLPMVLTSRRRQPPLVRAQ